MRGINVVGASARATLVQVRLTLLLANVPEPRGFVNLGRFRDVRIRYIGFCALDTRCVAANTLALTSFAEAVLVLATNC